MIAERRTSVQQRISALVAKGVRLELIAGAGEVPIAELQTFLSSAEHLPDHAIDRLRLRLPMMEQHYR